MNQQHSRGLSLDDKLHDFPRMDTRAVDRAAEQLHESQRPMTRVQAQDAEVLAIAFTQVDCKEIPHDPGRGECRTAAHASVGEHG